MVLKQVQDDIDFYIRVKGVRQPWNDKSQQWYDFAIMNKQWTTQEEDELKRRGQAPLVVNRLKPIIRLYQSHIGARTPRIRTIPLRSDIGAVTAQKLSTVFNDLFHWIWYNSNGDSLMDQVIEDFLVRGIGYFYIYHDKYGCDGRGQIKVDYIHPNEVYVDSESRKKDFSDASKIIISREITVQEAELKLPDFKRKIRAAIDRYCTRDDFTKTDLTTGDDLAYYDEIYDETSERVRLFDVYEKRIVTMWDVVNPATGQYKMLSDDEFNKFKETGAKYAASKVYVNRVFRRLIVGDILIGEEMLPTSIYPIVPVIFQHVGNPYPMSLVSYGMDLQKEVNKRRSLLIAHATSNAGGTKIIYEEGAVSDKEQTEVDWARPNGWTAVNDINLIKEIPPTPLPPSLVQLEQFAKYDMEYIMGTPATAMGFNENAHETYKGVLALDEFSQRNTGPAVKALYLALKVAGKVIIDFIQYYMSGPQIIRVTQPYDNPTEEFKTLMLNQNVYDDKTGAIDRIENDITIGRYDVEVIANSTMASNQAALEEQMLAYFNAGLVDDIEVYKHVNIFDKQGLLARKSLLSQQQNMIKQLSQELENLSNMANEATKALKDEQQKHEVTKFKKHLNDVKLRAKEMQLGLDTQMKRAIDEFRLASKAAKQERKGTE